MTNEYQTTVALRWSDQDTNGHVNHARVVTLIEEARIQWLNRDAPLEELRSFDSPKVVASLSVDYLLPISVSESLTIRISTVRIGKTSFTLAYEGTQNGPPALIASTTLVMLDPETKRPRPLTVHEVDYLQNASATTH